MEACRKSAALAALALVLCGQSCLFKKEPRKATIIIPPAPQPPPPQPMPTPPNLPPAQSTGALTTETEVPALPAPAEPAAKKRSRPARRPNASTTNVPAAPAETVPAAEPVAATPAPVVPALQPILGNQEIGERNKRISAYLEKARLNVYRAERNRPSAQTVDLISQVKTFVQQAEEARKTDLVRAENLAERAEVLSRGLNR